MEKRNLNGGYVGLLILFLGVALMIFFIVRTDIFTGQKGEKSMLEKNIDAVDSANALKIKLEQNAIPVDEE